MIRASALYLVIVIALVIGIICAAIISVAYFYNLNYQRKFRYERLQNNLVSGTNLLLRSARGNFKAETKMRLFDNEMDSVTLRLFPWGLYDIGAVQAFFQKDTLFRTFSIAPGVDSSKWATLYLTDEDRPLSVSGKTAINGNVYLPKAGVKSAYVNNTFYEGREKIIAGHEYDSGRSLPSLNIERLATIEKGFKKSTNTIEILNTKLLKNSFFCPVYSVDISSNPVLKDISLSGNVAIYADTIVTIEGTADLKNIIVFAKSIVVKKGFHGNCQLFARDSINVGPDCRFGYPSCLGLIRKDKEKVQYPGSITVGRGTIFSGIIFNNENLESNVKMVINIGNDVNINGEIYSSGITAIKDNLVVNGMLSTTRFLYRGSYSVYENYLINVQFDSSKLPSYYLTSDLFWKGNKENKVLQWLEVH